MNESSYKHNYEYLSIEEAKAIINGTFVQGSTNIGGELATKSDIDSLLDAAGKHMTSIVAGDGSEYVCYFEWASNRVDPTGVSIQDITINVGESKQLTYNITPSNSTIDSVTYEIVSGSDFAHIENSIIYADKEGLATYKVIINNSVTATANITISDTYTYKDVYDVKSDLMSDTKVDNCGYVFDYNETGSDKSKYFYINAHRDKIGSKGNVVSSEKINYTFSENGNVDNFVINISKQDINNKEFDKYQVYPKSENSSNDNYELSISIKNENSDYVFLFNAIHICKGYVKIANFTNGVEYSDYISNIDHNYVLCNMNHIIYTNIKQKGIYDYYPTYSIENYSGQSRKNTKILITGANVKTKYFEYLFQSNNVAKGYFTLYLCKYNQYGNIYNSNAGSDEKTSSHTLNFNFISHVNNDYQIHQKIFSITKDFTAIELDGVEYNGNDPSVIPIERYTKMYELLFFPCASTVVYKTY